MARTYTATAFPVTAENGLGHISDGMSLRDWFAGHAAAGTLAAMNPGFVDKSMAIEIAHGAYLVADALLVEGDK